MLQAKILYHHDPHVPDNYTGPRFLESLVLNANAQQRNYWQVAWDSAVVVQQLSAVAASAAVFVFLQEGTISVEFMLGLDVTMLVLGCLLSFVCGGTVSKAAAARGGRQSALLVLGVYLMSPVMRTLTLSISTDTIIACTAALFLVHLYLHDYSFVNSVTEHLAGSLSLGAAVCGCVLLSSRLPSDGHVFAQILFSLELFVLSPFLRRRVKQASGLGHLALSGGMAAGAFCLLLRVSPSVGSGFLSAIIFILALCPYWLVRIGKFKNEIRGPWDEASI